jgi:hypothetical protein
MLVALAMIALAVGCQKPPAERIDAAHQALDRAKTAEASEYAPASLAAAEDAIKRLEEEMALQNDKWFRSYKKTGELAEAAVQASDKAVSDARTAKEQAHVEATNMIADARTMLDEADQLLKNAPAGKGTAADLAAMRLDLDHAGTILGEADSALAAERFTEAKAKAEAARAQAEQVRDAVMTAMQSRRGSGSRRG